MSRQKAASKEKRQIKSASAIVLGPSVVPPPSDMERGESVTGNEAFGPG